MSNKPNIVFILADQLRAASLPVYGERQIATPNLDRLAAQGVTFNNAISTSPVCTPYRSMLLTGRHPQTTGHVMNFLRTRHDEISVADVFGRAGYRTGWIGKWHLHTGCFPTIEGEDFVPEGRDRLGFQFWRGYNFHSQYFDGWVNRQTDWRTEQWKGYETQALNRYAFEFMDGAGADPFCVFVSPHQPHYTPTGRYAPEQYYARLPGRLELPPNVTDPDKATGRQPWQASPREMYRHYLAMTLALDDMVGEMLDYLDRTGRAENTLVVFTSDHGTQVGAHGINPWAKQEPYEESIRVPLIMRLPGVLAGGQRRDTLTAPVDFLPSLCGLCGLKAPRSVEGHDLSSAWAGRVGAAEQDAVLMMNFSGSFNHLTDGAEWRGVRTQRHMYARWLGGRTALYDLAADPLEMHNLADDASHAALRLGMEGRMRELTAAIGDDLVPCSAYASWFDHQRRVIRNTRGPLGNPEREPDWTLLA